jgi:two-component system sensor histidine kinase CreC
MLGLAAWFVLNIFMHEAEPGIRQATEETLVDTAHVLAELAAPELAAGSMADGGVCQGPGGGPRALAAGQHLGRARIASIFVSTSPTARGGWSSIRKALALGADYSQWRDVARVLKGEYGARSTREQAGDATSSVMYVAAPIVRAGS